ncbi:MAG: hypothetical protein ACYSU5_03520 [Planctomycetota bacterium]
MTKINQDGLAVRLIPIVDLFILNGMKTYGKIRLCIVTVPPSTTIDAPLGSVIYSSLR